MPDSTPSPPPPSDAPADLYDLGILFVHGIGEQERSSTLVSFGEPLYRWFEQWFEGLVRSWRSAGLQWAHYRVQLEQHFATAQTRTPDENVARLETLRLLIGSMGEVADPSMVPPIASLQNDVASGMLSARVALRDAHGRNAADDTPAHAAMDLHALGVDGSAHHSRWLLAESWWAQTFFEPKFRELAQWLVLIIPWTLGTYYGNRVRRAVRRVRTEQRTSARLNAAVSALTNLIFLILSLPFAALIEGLVVLVVLLALAPVPKLRRVLLALERVLARTLGDSFVLVSSPLQQAAVIAQVQRDVAWLSSRCRSVAVVAHSQGAAVAHRALRHGRPPRVQLLVTFGSGLRKLEEIEEMARVSDGFYSRVYLTLASVLMIGYATWSAVVWERGWEPWTGIAGSLLFVFVVFSYLAGSYAISLSWFASLLTNQGLAWVDYHSTSDPVPNGSLQDHDPDVQGPLSFSICNERSLTADHTTYWENVEEFVGPAAWWLTRMVSGPWHAMVAKPPTFWMPAAVKRRWRVGGLVIGRWAAWLAMGAVLVTRSTDWQTVLAWTWSRMAAAVDVMLPGAITVAPIARPTADIWINTTGALLAIFALGQVSRLLWDRWNGLEQRAYFDRRPSAESPTPESWPRRFEAFNTRSAAFSASWLFFAAVAGQAWLTALFAPEIAGGRTIDWWTASWVVSGAGLVGATAYVLGLPSAINRALERRRVWEQAQRDRMAGAAAQ